MRRAAVTCVLILAVAVPLGATAAAPAATEILYRSGAEASGFHGFYDHQDLFPVPLFNLSVPYSAVAYEPGPATSAVGSFLWEPQAAELPAIFCQLSNGQFCGFPDYPFQARASYPSSGKPGQPPVLHVSDPRSPVRAEGADETAVASAGGARATGTVAGLEAIPMDRGQAAAAGRLAGVLAALSGPVGPLTAKGGPPSTTPWLLSIGSGVSRTAVTAGGATVTGHGAALDVELLGGLIRIEVASGTVAASMAGKPSGRATAGIAGVKVGDHAASIGPGGLVVADRSIGAEQRASLQDAANAALAGAGLSLSRGGHRVQRSRDGVTSVAWATSLDLEKQVVPGQAPQGTGGADTLHVPLGYATAHVAVTDLGTLGPAPSAGPPAPPPAPPPPRSGGALSQPPANPPAVSSGGGQAAAPGAGGRTSEPRRSGPSTTGPVPAAAPRLRPVTGTIARGVPLAAIALVLLIGVGAIAGLTWLKTTEVLVE